MSVTIRIYDTDFWHHLLVGKVIWQSGRIPTRQLWSWSTYGTPDMNASPLFRWALWPFWSVGGVGGLFAWRWLTTLAAFGMLWATARRIGARGLTTLLVFTVCVLIYRQRSQVRPETLAAVLLALTLWILESWRQGGHDRRAWLIAIAWAWANAHLSYYMLFLTLGLFAIDAWLPGAPRRDVPTRFGRVPVFVAIGAAAAAVSFINPFGWRSLWQPFQFALFWRHEPIYRTIGELQPVMWSNNARNGLLVIVLLWPLLAVVRAVRRGVDRVEWPLCAFVTLTMLNTQRLSGVYALVAAPYLARDLEDALRGLRWPAWMRPPWARAALVSVALVGVCLPEWNRIELPMGVDLDDTRYPMRACDFIAAHGVRGRGFNDTYLGGYIAWRFWPERDRLPFATGTPEAMTREDRDLATAAATRPSAWQRLDAKYRFDSALLNRRIETGSSFISDFLDADPAWALVFADDAAALYIRRDGPLAAIADSFAYHAAAGGVAATGPARSRALGDPEFRERLIAELERMARESPYDARAMTQLARLAYAERRWDDAARFTERAIAASPLTPGEHERLGRVALAENRPAEALVQFRAERRVRISGRGVEVLLGLAYQALGQRDQASRHYRAELALDPGNDEARAGLAALDATR